MKAFNRIIAVFCIISSIVLISINIVLVNSNNTETGAGLRKVEINRVVTFISSNGSIPVLDNYQTIAGIYMDNGTSDFFISGNDYVIRRINGDLYKIEFKKTSDRSYLIIIDIILILFSVIVIILLAYIKYNIIKPFNEISELPYELSKGNLTLPLKESKSRYFGRFLWGLDMLRAKMEQTRQDELKLQKEKKTMLMSLSHDIKTPLSAIKLYSKALSSGIYSERAKQAETAEHINEKADEIEKLVSDIMKSNNEDLMRFEVKDEEFYLTDIMDRINTYYTDKLSESGFSISEYSNCILYGDSDRLVEVLQNIIENAIKYGDSRKIAISFSDEEDHRLITVTNSGCMLPENELSHIFDSFWRGSNTGSNSGNGLGLYICRQLMHAMGGDIFAEIHNNEMSVTAVCRKYQ